MLSQSELFLVRLGYGRQTETSDAPVSYAGARVRFHSPFLCFDVPNIEAYLSTEFVAVFGGKILQLRVPTTPIGFNPAVDADIRGPQSNKQLLRW